ncbi:helix-turn-helix domain-containing protein [Microbacterium paraoxydans]|jgi:transcriptional regulator with XRE-family HTH domain|uniref:Cro/C1-type HTH DNA-binding domain-containing protein n=1 Tax=Microbacterium paraoxydans TaxID=199592 RepID=A0A1H1LB79_9MICO|nr:helix-turn-helix transcriptional regulator [Microbacterium paraoxydans]SDR71129.1 Cro/C1-type HTH DNA-binding domain-containing protein [Microbacterium paraoxydans]SDT08268.1 Cro/C1-type HTH DNA-binding domain-containing protein [Microbacterium paraoxydans]
MTQANEPQVTQTAQIRPGLLDRLKTNSGIKSDDAFARMIGISRATLQRLKSGEEPTLRTVIVIAQAFGLALGEVVEVVEVDADDLAVAV